MSAISEFGAEQLRIWKALAARAAVRAVIALAGAARDEPRPLVAVATRARRARVVAQLRRQLLAPLARIAVAAHASAEQLVAPAAAGAAAPAAAPAASDAEKISTAGDDEKKGDTDKNV